MDQTIIEPDYTHPETIYKDLIWAGDNEVLDKVWEKRKSLKTRFSGLDKDKKKEELCWCCGWRIHDEIYSSYGSRVRIFHTRGNKGIWAIGPRWLLVDQPNDSSLGSDFITQEFLRKQQNTIPLIKEMQRLNQPTDKIQLVLMSRAQGVGLDTVWHTLSSEEKMKYKDQLGSAIKQWRQLTSVVAEKVDGGELEDCIIGNCLRRTAPTCKKIGRTTDKWFENLEKDLRLGLTRIYHTTDPSIIEQEFQKLKKNFPKSEPYVLTHGDLNLSNIIVKDGKIEAIIDWEYSGFFPWWAERWLSLIGGNDQSDELFNPLWADIGVEMDEATFKSEVIYKVAPVMDAWNACKPFVEHPKSHEQWLRPGFCECKPYSGVFRWDRIGNQLEHRLRDTVNTKLS